MKFNTTTLKKQISLLFLFLGGILIAQTSNERQLIQNKSNISELNTLATSFNQKHESQKQEAITIAQAKNLPIRVTLEDGGFAELQRFAEDGSPIYYRTFNVDASRSTRTNHLNIGGSLGLNLDGQNMIAYVWDGGHALESHQEYDGSGGLNRVTLHDTGSEGGVQLHYHAAHVTGTITASGVDADAKGMAPRSRVRGYMWNNDIAEATAAAANGMLLSNHSYGFRSDLVPDQYFGAYISESRDWDEVMYNAPYYLMVVAAGNDGSSNYNGNPLGGNSAYDKLTGHATSKNNLVVANGQDANVNANGDFISMNISSTSSEGPTDDLRIKPDITGNGSGVYSTYDSSSTAYNSISGTSMASPNVTGSLLLLQQHYNNINGNYMRAASLKGLALHTADDAGPTGPDAVYGWGLLNAKLAAETITANGSSSRIEELTLTTGQTYTTTVESDGINKLMASISWTDAPGSANSATNSPTAALVNDLDIQVTQVGTTFNPWLLTGITTNGKGDNTKDNYERVDLDLPSGTYTITVTHKGNLSGGSQNFSLIVTGLGEGIADNVGPTTPTSLVASNITDNAVNFDWNESTDNVAVIGYDVFRDDVYYTAVSNNFMYLSGLTPNTTYSFKVRARDASGNTSGFSNEVSITTLAPIPVYCDSSSLDTSDEYISRVQLNTIDNSSGPQFYSDFTSISTDLEIDVTYTITVTPTWPDTLYDEGYAVWIDYNNDYDFDDAGELVWSKAPSQDTPNSGTFTIPNGVALGATRMRVSLKYNGIPTPCETLSFGEVEDYTVVLINGDGDTEAPTAPTNLTATVIEIESVTLNWDPSTDNIDVVLYDIYRDGSLLGSTSASINTYTSSFLTPNTAYSFHVIARDLAGNESESSNTVTVTTLADTEPPTSPSPLIATNETQTTVNLSWNLATDNIGVTGYDLYQDGDLIVVSNNTDYLVTGLTLDTSYDFFVRVRDAAGNTAQSNTLTITTPSSVYCTSESSNTNDEYISRVQLNTIDNTSDAQFYSDFTSISTDLAEGETYTITVTPTWPGTIYDEGYAVWIDYNNDQDFDDVAELVWSKAPSKDTPNTGTFTIPSGVTFGPTRMRVSLKYNAIPTPCESFTYGEVEDYTVNLGELVDTEPPTVPTNLVVSTITENSATFNWNPSVDNVNVTSYRLYRNGAINVTTSNTNYTTNSLTPGTAYSYYVVALDDAGNVSESSNIVQFTTDDVDDPDGYCLSLGSSVRDEYISRVQLNTIDHTSGGDYYSNYSTISTDLSQSEPYTITITPTWTDIIYSEGYAVWIDYNQDLDFEDPGELVWSIEPTQDTPVSGTFTVPSDALLGPTRMRVSLKYNDIPDPCEIFAYGEVEDYTVNILFTDSTPPTVPTNLVASAITESTVTLNWNASIDNSGEFEYFIYQDGSFITSVSEENTTITGLEPETIYSYYVRAIDPSGNASAISNVVEIQTDFVDPIVLHQGYFETSWDGWDNTEGNATRLSSKYTYERKQAIQMNSVRGKNTTIELGRIDLSTFENLNFNFYFYANAIRNSDSFKLEFWDGSIWNEIEVYSFGQNFFEEDFYNASITLDATVYSFSSNAKFRLVNMASSNPFEIYIDQVTISANVPSTTEEGIILVGERRDSTTEETQNIVTQFDVLVYPNPAQDILNIKTANQEVGFKYAIYNSVGQQIATGLVENGKIQVQNIPSGAYTIELTNGNVIAVKRFIKK